ncbi:MAG: serine hydrolase domain-containing protein, partial [Acidimicrobiia bacterium]
MTTIQGWTAPGFEVVRDRFEKNFADGLEVGAAFAAYHRGEKVVDLWGGTTDEATGQPWEEDTMIVVFSTTKGATAICANRLAQEGRLDVNAPVAEYWPEF